MKKKPDKENLKDIYISPKGALYRTRVDMDKLRKDLGKSDENTNDTLDEITQMNEDMGLYDDE